jgi:hypothetical protein
MKKSGEEVVLSLAAVVLVLARAETVLDTRGQTLLC